MTGERFGQGTPLGTLPEMPTDQHASHHPRQLIGSHHAVGGLGLPEKMQGQRTLRGKMVSR